MIGNSKGTIFLHRAESRRSSGSNENGLPQIMRWMLRCRKSVRDRRTRWR